LVKVRPWVIGLSVSADGGTLAVCGSVGSQGRVYLLDAATGKERLVLPPFAGVIRQVSLLPGNRLIATLDQDEGAVIRETVSGRSRVTAPELSEAYWMAVSPDGRWLAVACRDGKVRIWDVWAAREAHSFESQTGPVCALAFSPDGRLLGTAAQDTSVLIWDLSALRPAPMGDADPSPRQLAQLWDDLADHGPKAHAAVAALTAAPRRSVAFLGTHLPPAERVEPERLKRLLRDLDDEEFAVRSRAAKELARRAELIGPALRQFLAGNPSPEARRTVADLVAALDAGVPPSEQLRDLRAVEVLERIGTPEAIEVLRRLTSGVAESRLTQEAKAALRTLERRPAP
jgi:hypothetical protein